MLWDYKQMFKNISFRLRRWLSGSVVAVKAEGLEFGSPANHVKAVSDDVQYSVCVCGRGGDK